jgi:hypothetical protein
LNLLCRNDPPSFRPKRRNPFKSKPVPLALRLVRRSFSEVESSVVQSEVGSRVEGFLDSLAARSTDNLNSFLQSILNF